MRTEQQIFDEVVTKLRQQGEPCLAGAVDDPHSGVGACLYRDSKGRGCAVGVMLTEATIERLRNAGAMGIPVSHLIGWGDIAELEGALEEFWTDLQYCHDSAAVNIMPEAANDGSTTYTADQRAEWLSGFERMIEAFAAKHFLTIMPVQS